MLFLFTTIFFILLIFFTKTLTAKRLVNQPFPQNYRTTFVRASTKIIPTHCMNFISFCLMREIVISNPPIHVHSFHNPHHPHNLLSFKSSLSTSLLIPTLSKLLHYPTPSKIPSSPKPFKYSPSPCQLKASPAPQSYTLTALPPLSLNVWISNIQGLCSNLTDLSIQAADDKPNIIWLTESFLPQEVPDYLVYFPGCCIFQFDQPEPYPGGRDSLYVKNSISHCFCTDLTLPDPRNTFGCDFPSTPTSCFSVFCTILRTVTTPSTSLSLSLSLS